MEEPLKSAAIRILEKIAHPVLIMVGDMDDDSKSEIADMLVQLLPRAQKVMISGSAHLPNMEKPNEFNQLVLGFLQHM